MTGWTIVTTPDGRVPVECPAPAPFGNVAAAWAQIEADANDARDLAWGEVARCRAKINAALHVAAEAERLYDHARRRGEWRRLPGEGPPAPPDWHA